MTNGNFSVLAGDGKRLDFTNRIASGGRIAGVSDSARARQRFQNVLAQNIGNQSHRAKLMQVFAVAGNDSARFLTAMLQREKSELRKVEASACPKIPNTPHSS
jgi:hypothetical protein